MRGSIRDGSTSVARVRQSEGNALERDAAEARPRVNTGCEQDMWRSQ
jgi:hypothetical protein